MSDAALEDALLTEAAEEVAEATNLRRLEAILFASPDPLTEDDLAGRLPGVDIAGLAAQLEEAYRNRGVNLRRVAGGWQMVTAPDCAAALVTTRPKLRRLGRAALETLSVIAYHQPCSRADIEEVRGAQVSKGSLDTLLELGWVRAKGRRPAPGRPLLYVTTPQFLAQYGLDTVADLPGRADLEAAGLLDGGLPPDFSVPRPQDDDEAEFVTDYGGEPEDQEPEEGEDA